MILWMSILFVFFTTGSAFNNQESMYFYGSESNLLLEKSITITMSSVHWCIISKTESSRTARLYFDHFPHAAESLLPCWSWWRRRNAVEMCGIIFLDGLKLPPGSWHDQLVNKIWNCHVRFFGSDNEVNTTHPLGEYGIYHSIPLRWKLPRHGRINYMECAEDAWSLRRLFISDEDIVRIKGGVLQVGIIQRTRSRVITTIEGIVDTLQKNLPEANLTISTNMPLALEEQAVWFATKDIIIAAHGAALMNCIFILPQTIVMQLYPKDFFWQSLESAIELPGGIALDFYFGNDPVLDWLNTKNQGGQNIARESNISAEPQRVVYPILNILGLVPVQ